MIMCNNVVTDVEYTVNNKKVIFQTAMYKESS